MLPCCLRLQFGVAWRFHVGAWRALKKGRANMDVLVSLGTNASYMFSVLTLFFERTHPVCPAICTVFYAALSLLSCIQASVVPAARFDVGFAGRPLPFRKDKDNVEPALLLLQVLTGSEGAEPAEFFETCAMLITFICLGKYLECAAKGKTSAAIAALMGLAPPTALLLELDSEGKAVAEREIPTSLVQRGDALKASFWHLVRP